MQIEPTPFIPGQLTRVDEIRRSIINAANCNVPLTGSYLIKSWFSSEGVSILFGESNVGKSFLALDAALHIGAGEPWHGQRVRQGRVLYIASEGGRSIKTRIEAVKHECPELHAKATPNIDLIPLQVDLHAAGDADAIIEVAPGNYHLVIIDTLAQSFGVGNENEGRDMNAVISNIMKLRAHYDCQVLLVHHSGKDADRGARGHSSLRAAVDTEIQLKREGNVRVATVTKQRDMPTGGKLAYTLKPARLGADEDGDEVVSCVVVPADMPQKGPKRLQGFNEVAHQALMEAIQRHGRRIEGSEIVPSTRRVVETKYWRDEAIRRGLGDGKTGGASRKAFDRAKDALQKADIVRECDGMAWLVSGEEDIRDMS